MREIKFRAWDTEEKEMLFNVQNTYDFGCRNDNKVMEESFGEVLSKGKYIVEQFTGLLDRNGKEIYEGDAVSGYVMGSYRNGWEVQWYDRTAQFVLHGNGITYGMDDLYPEKLEIIGNIHEGTK